MSSQSIYYYEEQFKEYIMNALVGERVITINQLHDDFIRENPEDHKVINFAYLNVLNELSGFHADGGDGGEL
ncbi:hypothetical protein QMK38_11855 [Lysinibacillus fusiformis]|nr:hypothetical protein [Lysinibacillus fusiformis]